MRTNIKLIHWVATPPLTGLIILAGSFPVSEDRFGPNYASPLASEVSCDPTVSLIGAVLGAAAMLGILVWSYRWQTRSLRSRSN